MQDKDRAAMRRLGLDMHPNIRSVLVYFIRMLNAHIFNIDFYQDQKLSCSETQSDPIVSPRQRRHNNLVRNQNQNDDPSLHISTFHGQERKVDFWKEKVSLMLVLIATMFC